MSFNLELITEIICLLMVTVAFVYGVIKLFKPNKPLYFQLYVIASACRLLERLITVVLIICGMNDKNMSIAAFLGTFAFALFALSANYGTLDGIVDDKSDDRNRKARCVALIAPAIFIAFSVYVEFLYIRDGSPWTGILMGIVILPCVPASYYTLKHLLLPVDAFGLLDATRGCNIFVMIAYGMGIVNNILNAAFSGSPWLMVVHIIVYSLPGFMIYFAVKGAEKWKTLT